MCLILLSYQPGTARPLVVAANRDEFHARATQAAGFWPEHPDLVAGKDLLAGGTWLGCTRTGRFAALTNFSQDTDPSAPRSWRSGARVLDLAAQCHGLRGVYRRPNLRRF